MKTLGFALLALFALVGCKSDDSSKPPTGQEISEFKGNPNSPELQKALQGHFGGPPSTPPPAAGTAPAATTGG